MTSLLAALLFAAAPACAQQITEVMSPPDFPLRVEAVKITTTPVNATLVGSTVAVRNASGVVIDPATEGTLATRATEATLATRASEATLATRATESTQVAVSTTAAAIKARADLLATEATLAAIKAQTDQLTFSTTSLKVAALIVDRSTPSIAAGVSDRTSAGLGQRLRVEIVEAESRSIPVSMTTSLASVQGKKFGATTGVQNKVGAAEEALVLIRNPAGSGKEMRMNRQVFVSVDQGVNLLFRFYRNPTVTSTGTVITINNMNIGLPQASVMQAFLGPTVSANGTIVTVFQARDNPFDDAIADSLLLRPGTEVLITVESSGNNKRWAYTGVWTEEP